MRSARRAMSAGWGARWGRAAQARRDVTPSAMDRPAEIDRTWAASLTRLSGAGDACLSQRGLLVGYHRLIASVGVVVEADEMQHAMNKEKCDLIRSAVAGLLRLPH